MLEMLDLDRILRGGSWSTWLMVFLLVLVFFLLRRVTDLTTDVQVVRTENTHHVTPSFMTSFLEKSNERQLKRIRDAYRRTVAKGAETTFDVEIQREIDMLRSNKGVAGGAPLGSEDLYDSDAEVDVGQDDNDFEG